MKDKRNTLDIEEAIFNAYNQGKSKAEINKIAREYHIPAKKLDEFLFSHYYLAPLNILRAQVLIALVIPLLSLTLALVRVGSDMGMIIFIAAGSLLLSLPFLIFFAFLRKERRLELIRTTSYISLIYCVFLSIWFVFMLATLEVYGAIILPMVIIFAYLIEVKKLNKLIEISIKYAKSSDK